MELRHLRYFVFVAEELHFGRAAARAGIAQPPLSQQIRSLEAELGVQLFNRTKRSVELTDAGRALLPEARETLRHAERAEEAARDGALGVSGRLNVGFVGSVAFEFLPRFLRAYRVRAGDVRLDLRELTSEQQRAAIREHVLDLGLVRYPAPDPEIVTIKLMSDPLLVAIPADHRLAFRPDPVHVETLAGEPFVIFPRQYGPPFFDRVMSICREAGFTPRIEQEAIQMPTIVSLVSAGVGVAIVPGSVRQMRLPEVRYRRLLDQDGHSPGTEVYLIRRSDQESSLLDLAVSIAREAADDGSAERV